MREMIVIRVSDHQNVDSVTEYNFQVALPGQFQAGFSAASQEELSAPLWDALSKILSTIHIPGQVQRITEVPQLAADKAPQFYDSTGKLINMMTAEATAKFSAQVIRNGQVVED
jgi:hypothetical protein